MVDLAKRLIGNPILSPADILPSTPDMEVVCVMNPGVFRYVDKTWLVIRVAERPREKVGLIQIPLLDEHDQLRIISYQTDDPKIDCRDARYVIYDNQTKNREVKYVVLRRFFLLSPQIP